VEISSWIAHWASSTPPRTALRFGGRVVSYVELEQAVGSVSGWFADNGVSSGDRVAYLGPNCPELLEALFACARLGAVFVPLNNRMPAAELRVFVDATQPRLLIAEQEFGDIALESAGDLAMDRGAHVFSGR
jgi:fatty-acyl-CoA synthase